MMLAFYLALGIPLIIAFFIWYITKKEVSLKLICASLVWGFFAGAATIFINNFFSSDLYSEDYNKFADILVRTPVVEELLKFAGILILI